MNKHKKHEITAKVTGLKRLKNSLQGNPNYMIYTDNGVTTTRSDSMLNYKISYNMQNETYKFYITEYKSGKTYLDNFEKI
jgi:hypothetical protein